MIDHLTGLYLKWLTQRAFVASNAIARRSSYVDNLILDRLERGTTCWLTHTKETAEQLLVFLSTNKGQGKNNTREVLVK